MSSVVMDACEVMALSEMCRRGKPASWVHLASAVIQKSQLGDHLASVLRRVLHGLRGDCEKNGYLEFEQMASA